MIFNTFANNPGDSRKDLDLAFSGGYSVLKLYLLYVWGESSTCLQTLDDFLRMLVKEFSADRRWAAEARELVWNLHSPANCSSSLSLLSLPAPSLPRL